MSTIAQPTAQPTANVASTPSAPRLVLAGARSGRAVLDGGWWPRSWDPAAELPGLIEALSSRYGTIRQVMLNNATWDSRFRLMAVGGRVVRAGWFTSVDPALLIATTDSGQQVDLLVVPPSTGPDTAGKAMAAAADPANRRRAQTILTDPSAASAPAGPRDDEDAPVTARNGRRL